MPPNHKPAAGRRKPAGKKAHRIPGPLWVRIGLLLGLVGVLALASFGIYFYSRFSRMIDSRLNGQPIRQAAVYTRPVQLSEGQKITAEELSQTLDRLGYHRAGRDGFPLWYEIEDTGVRIGQPTAGGGQETLQIQISARGVLHLPTAGQSRQSRIFLQPQFLSTLHDQSREKRKHVTFAQLPANLVHAVLAAEDDRFFSHHGLDFLSMARAAAIDLLNWAPVQGASTLTQQLAKNFFLTPVKSPRRKMEEAMLAILLESRLTKEEIFELYANDVYLGQLGSFAIHGLGEGAYVYLGKNVKDLTLAECALLAGIIQAPNRFSSLEDREQAQARRNAVLALMHDKDFITGEQYAEAVRDPLSVLHASRIDSAEAPYFIDYLRRRLTQEKVPWRDAGRIEVHTTLDAGLQKAAFEAVQEGLQGVDEWRSRRKRITPVAQAALVALDPRSGELLAMIGGRDYASGQFNRATDAFRQPGSTFKPFVLAAALEFTSRQQNPITLSTLYVDEPYSLAFENKEYAPSNFGDKYYGNVTVRKIISQSLNVPTLKVAEQIGFSTIVETSRKLGFRENLRAYPSIALGVFEVSLLELAQAYSVFANQGLSAPLRAINSIEVDGVDTVLPRADPVSVLGPEVSFLVTSAMESVLNEGTGAAARGHGFQLPAAGKTGSSNDAWFVGFTPELLCAVWVGLDDAGPLGLTGTQAALPIWSAFMRKAQAQGLLDGRNFEVPQNLVSVPIDEFTGLRATRHCEQIRFEFFMPGTEPRQECPGDEESFNLAEFQERQKGPGIWRWLRRVFR